MKRTHLYIYIQALLPFLLVSLILCGCAKRQGQTAHDRYITVSIEPLRYVAEAIAGDKYRVQTLMPQGASPETYEPSPKRMMALNDSRLVMRVGTLGFEKTKLPQMVKSAKDVALVDLSQGIELIESNHKHDGEELESGDPHVWMSTRNLQVMAANACRALCAADSANASYYKERLTAFTKEMQSLQSELSTLLQSEKGKAFLIYHPALGYFAKEYGLQQLAVEHDGKEASAQYLQALVDACRAKGVRTVFVSKEHNGRTAQQAAQAIGAKVTTINPLDYHVKEQMRLIATSLKNENNK